MYETDGTGLEKKVMMKSIIPVSPVTLLLLKGPSVAEVVATAFPALGLMLVYVYGPFSR